MERMKDEKRINFKPQPTPNTFCKKRKEGEGDRNLSGCAAYRKHERFVLKESERTKKRKEKEK